MKLFEMDSPLTRFLSRLADLMLLNILTLLLCLPVVTGGAAITAMHYVLLKIVKNEEGYIVKSFFKSFRLNFLQSTVMWIILLAVGGALWACCGYPVAAMSSGKTGSYLIVTAVMALMALVLLAAVSVFLFPLQARYTNPVGRTMVNALALAFRRPLKTISMLVITFFPIGLVLTVDRLFPLLILFGLSVPAYACAQLYVPVFDKLEESAQPRHEADL